MTMYLRVVGMHGLGDCLHQRAVIRQLLRRYSRIWLETPWPCVYHDMVGDRLLLVDKRSPLRTQRKNATREQERYAREPAPRNAPVLRIQYPPAGIRRYGSVVAAMLAGAGLDPADTDFALPVPGAWRLRAEQLLAGRGEPAKPLMVMRPLVDRREWGGCFARNPDPAAYAALYASIRERFHVISVADLDPPREWLVGIVPDADLVFHGGELDIEILAALVRRAALVYCSPGFMVPLSQAVGTAACVVFGGYEDATSFSAGARMAPYLPIEPIRPCPCFLHRHNCNKAIDLSAALAKLGRFANDLAAGEQIVA